MKVRVDPELINIVREIHAESKTLDEWSEIESDDMFQSNQYCGGFEGTEGAFCFSYFASDGTEYWFQFNLEDVEKILSGEITSIEGRPADLI